MARLQGRVAFVAGAGAGIGRAIAADLAREWASVDVADGGATAHQPWHVLSHILHPEVVGDRGA